MVDKIDRVFYINLKKRVDRKQEIEDELNKVGLLEISECFEAIETPGFGIHGCGLSHLNVLKLSKERGYENIIIFEDDFVFLVKREEFYEQIKCFFDLQLDYDVCFLAYNLLKHDTTPYDNLYRVLDAQTASGYIVNKKSFDKLINLYEWSLPLLKSTRQHWVYSNDIIWKIYQAKDDWYCFTTRIGKQRDGFSDIGGCFTKPFC